MDERKLKSFERDLKKRVRGGVYFDPLTRGIYATDASIYQLTPVAVVTTVDEEDVFAAVKTASKYGVSILPRGGGTSLNGQGCGHSMILDFTRHMSTILELNPEEKWARVQPGIVLDVLNAKLAAHGLQFAPDPATSSRATVGGMMGNNSAGTKSLLYGMTRDHVLSCRFLLADGTMLELKELSSEVYRKKSEGVGAGVREAEIYRDFKKMIDANRDEINARFPKIMRRVQGYGLDVFATSEQWNLSRLVIGSEGTLGTFLDSTLKLVPLPKAKVLCAVHFADLLEAIRTVSPILSHNPSAVEIMDDEIVHRARENLSIRPLTGFIEGDPKAVLIVEFFGETVDEAAQKAHALAGDLKKQKLGYSWPVIAQPAEQVKIWAVRKHGLGLMLGIKGDRKPLPIIEDCAVPIEILPEYVDKMLKFCKKRDIPVAMYAHASVGVIHVRPALNLKDRRDIEYMKALAEYAFGLVKDYGGSLSGEHGDGRVRSPFLEGFFGTQIYDVFRQTKRLFDPQGLMNPGVIVDPAPMDRNLRYGTEYKTHDSPAVYHFREEGSFAAAVEMCTGVGDCRQRLSGTMCPSYRVTFEEALSTRGYANALRLAMTGQLGAEAMADKRLLELLDHCLSCKACKSECPSNVDMARLKGEFLNSFFTDRRFPARMKIMQNLIRRAEKFSGASAPTMNFLHRIWPVKQISALLSGIDVKRRLPAYARVCFDSWFSERGGPSRGAGKVALFAGCVTNYLQPEVGRSAVELLESCGYEVLLARTGCCQRPKIDAGFLREAKEEGEKTLRGLESFIEQGIPVVVCEPGCWSALVDDLPDLIEDETLAASIKKNVVMIDDFIAEKIKSGGITCGFSSPFESIIIHVHSHRQALFGADSMQYVLDRVPGMNAELLDAGCCGNVGFYGFVKGHRDLSMKIGEERLFPAIRKKPPETTVVACGFDCRTQIADATGVAVVHWVDTLRGAAV